MTITAYPFDGVDTTEAQYSNLFQQLQDDGLGVVPTSTQGKVTAGSGLGLNVGAFDLLLGGGFAMKSTAIEALTIDTADASPRIDRIVAQIDPTTNSASLVKIKGTPGAIPVAPALTKTSGGVWQVPLARVAVAAGAVNIVSGDITDERLFLGTRVGAWTTAARPAPRKGLLGFNFTSSEFEWNTDGTSGGWTSLTPSALDAAVITSGTFAAARIPNLDASKINAGTFDAARIPSLDASKIGSGTLPLARGGLGATTAAGGRTTLGSTTVGDALFVAASVTAAREALHIFVRTTPGAPAVGDLRTRDA